MTSGAITPASRLSVRQGVSTNPDADLAVRELAAQIRQPESRLDRKSTRLNSSHT